MGLGSCIGSQHSMNTAVSHLQDLLGITLDAAWVQRSVPHNVDRDTLLKAFLVSDLVDSSPGCLPADWQVCLTNRLDWANRSTSMLPLELELTRMHGPCRVARSCKEHLYCS